MEKKMKKSVKKLLCTLLVAIMCLSSVPLGGFVGLDFGDIFSVKASATSELAESGKCGYNVYWSFDSSTGELTISGTGDMYSYNWNGSPFYESDIKSVVIADGVTSVDEYAFYNCTSLTSVTIPDSVTSIGYCAFNECSSLTSVTIPDSVTSIGHFAFDGCTSLISVKIPNSVTSIGSATFYGCTSLTSITIPDSVTSIDDYAFYNCTSLTSIIIPDSVTSIGSSAFENTGYYNNEANWEDSVLYIGNHLIDAKTSITSCDIKGGTLCIADYVFSGCTSLTSIIIPDSVTSIGGSAFENTGYYNDANNWENDVLYIGKYLIKAKTSITSCEIKVGTLCITHGAFEDCTSLKSVTIPGSVTSIGSSAFYGCESLTSVTIPNSVTSIGDCAFIGCTNLTSITIPDSVTSIGNEAFFGCFSLNSITVDGDNAKYSSDEHGVLFNKDKTVLIQYPIGNKLTEYIIPETVEVIDECAFAEAFYLEKAALPEELTTINFSAFYICPSLLEITFPKSLGIIGVDAIADCWFIDRIYFKSMDTVFSDNYSVGYSEVYVESISREEFVKLWIDHIKTGDEKYEEYLKCSDDPITIGTIYCHSGSTAETYAIENGMDYVLTHFYEGDWIDDYNNMVRYRKCIHCDEREEISIANSLAASGQCGDNAYWSFDSKTGKLDITGTGDMWDFTSATTPFKYVDIKSVAIEDGITSIGDYAFWDCRNLSNITIPESVASIGEEAFYRCLSLTSIDLKNGLTTIKKGAFFRCEGLESITIPASVNCIETSSFERCYALTKINVDKDNEWYSSDEYGVLFNKDKTTLIQYPCGSETTKYIVPETVTSIENGAMYYSLYLKELVLSNNITELSQSAFYMCFSLSKIDLPN